MARRRRLPAQPLWKRQARRLLAKTADGGVLDPSPVLFIIAGVRSLPMSRGIASRMTVNLPRRLAAYAVMAACAGLVGGAAQAGERLDTIKARGFLTCGVGANVPGFSQRDPNGA